MAKIFVQIRDTGSVFYDGSEEITVSGVEPVEVEETAKVVRAIKGGALKRLETEEANAILEQLKPAEDLGETEGVITDLPPVDEVGGTDYNIFTLSELKAELTSKGIEFDSASKKVELIGLLENNVNR